MLRGKQIDLSPQPAGGSIFPRSLHRFSGLTLKNACKFTSLTMNPNNGNLTVFGEIIDQTRKSRNTVRAKRGAFLIVALIRNDRKLTIGTDLCDGHISSVLMQDQSIESAKVIGYWLVSCNHSGRSYATTEIVLLDTFLIF